VSELVTFALGDAEDGVVVELDDTVGVVRAARGGDAPGRATAAFETGFGQVRAAAAHALEQLSTLPRRPDTVELEFGIKFSAEAGAILARTGAEGHLKVRMVWDDRPSGSTGRPGATAEGGESAEEATG
jgi:hypothetical protein